MKKSLFCGEIRERGSGFSNESFKRTEITLHFLTCDSLSDLNIQKERFYDPTEMGEWDYILHYIQNGKLYPNSHKELG